MRTRLSRCLRKRWFASAAAALDHARAAGLDLRAYRCNRCRRFHLTGRTKGKWMPRGAPLTLPIADREKGSGSAFDGTVVGGGE